MLYVFFAIEYDKLELCFVRLNCQRSDWLSRKLWKVKGKDSCNFPLSVFFSSLAESNFSSVFLGFLSNQTDG